MSTGLLPFSNPYDKTPQDIFDRIQKGKLNKFPSSCGNVVKDLIKKLLNPDPRKRLGYQSFKELIHHPYFEGCFEDSGKLKKNQLAHAGFKIEPLFEENMLTPIPHELLFRIDDINSNEIIDFEIKGFTHIDPPESIKSNI
jgi:serine/threonine protein kinase